jgi:hypothetical protein
MLFYPTSFDHVPVFSKTGTNQNLRRNDVILAQVFKHVRVSSSLKKLSKKMAPTTDHWHYFFTVPVVKIGNVVSRHVRGQRCLQINPLKIVSLCVKHLHPLVCTRSNDVRWYALWFHATLPSLFDITCIRRAYSYLLYVRRHGCFQNDIIHSTSQNVIGVATCFRRFFTNHQSFY